MKMNDIKPNLNYIDLSVIRESLFLYREMNEGDVDFKDLQKTIQKTINKIHKLISMEARVFIDKLEKEENEQN